MLTNEQINLLKQALAEQEQHLLTSLPDEAEYTTADFSERHQRRMEKLFNRCDSFYYPAIRTRARRVVTLAATIALAFALAISGSALLQKLDVEDFKATDGFFDETAEQYLAATNLFNNKVNVQYVDTIKQENGTVLNRYVDEQGNEYQYYTDGTLRSLWPSEETAKAFREKVVVPMLKNTKTLSEKQAKDLAATILKEFVGDDFSNYQFRLIENVESTEMYYVHFAKIYNGDYIGERCMAAFSYTGELHLVNNKGTVTLRDFDTSVLTDELDETLDKFIVEQFHAAEYDNNKFINYELRKKTILEKDGKVGIQVEACGYFKTVKGTTGNLKTFFYPFPDQSTRK